MTIFGEQVGEMSFSLLASPASEGLFHRAIAQSGHVRSLMASEAYNAEREYPMVDRGSWEVVRELGLSNASVDAEALRAVSMLDLLAAYFELEEDHIQPAVIRDGVVIPEEGVLAALADPRYAKNVPVMAGTTRDEVTLWLGLSRYFVDVSYPLQSLACEAPDQRPGALRILGRHALTRLEIGRCGRSSVGYARGGLHRVVCLSV